MEQETIFQSLSCRINVYLSPDRSGKTRFFPMTLWLLMTQHQAWEKRIEAFRLHALSPSWDVNTLKRISRITELPPPPHPQSHLFLTRFHLTTHHPALAVSRITMSRVTFRAALRQRAVDFVSWYFCCAINSPNWWSCQRRAQVATAWPRQHFGLQTVAGVTASIKSPRELSNIVSTRVLSLIANHDRWTITIKR